MRVRRLRKEAAGLDVTAFINLIIVLVPFLLSTAVFTQLAIHELSLPAQASNALQDIKDKDQLQLEVVLRQDVIEIQNKLGGDRLGTVPRTDKGYDFKSLHEQMRALKAALVQRGIDKRDVALLPEPGVPYDVIVQAMDAIRIGKQTEGNRIVDVDLFPDLSIGDAPVRTAAK